MLFREFAVDPELFGDYESFRYIADGLGVHTGRMLAKFPKDWQKRAYAASRHLTPVEIQRAELRLTKIKEFFLPGGRPFDGAKSWCENAVDQHQQSPFHAVILTNHADPATLSETVIKAEALDTGLPPWKVSVDCVQIREAASLCAVAKPLLHISKEIVFVDRYFEGGPGHGRPLAAFLAECFTGTQPHRIEYHCDDRSTFAFFADKIRQMERFLPPLPAGFRIRFIRWRSLPDGDSPHPRYILTDRGGLRYDYGLSEEDGKTTDIGILGPDVYKRRWSEYSASGAAFEFVDGLELRDHKLAVLRKDGSVFVTGPVL